MNDAEGHLMTVFSAALERGSAAERQAYLDQACADDPALRHAVHLPLTVGHPLRVIRDQFEPAVNPAMSALPWKRGLHRARA